MKLGQLTRVEVDDVTFLIALEWGQYKVMIDKLDKIDDDDGPAQLAFTEQCLLKIVHTIKGMTLDDNTEVESLDQVVGQTEPEEGEEPEDITVLDKLPPLFILRLWKRVVEIGDEAGDGVVPPA